MPYSWPEVFILTIDNGGVVAMAITTEQAIAKKEDQVRLKFAELVVRTNKESPRAADVRAISDMLNGNESLELWRAVHSAGQFAEMIVLEDASAMPAIKECWKHRMQALRKHLGAGDAPMLEQLLIQQAALCWLRLNLVEIRYSTVMKQSITLTLGIYWEKRLTAAQRRFTRACESLARIRKLSR